MCENHKVPGSGPGRPHLHLIGPVSANSSGYLPDLADETGSLPAARHSPVAAPYWSVSRDSRSEGYSVRTMLRRTDAPWPEVSWPRRRGVLRRPASPVTSREDDVGSIPGEAAGSRNPAAGKGGEASRPKVTVIPRMRRCGRPPAGRRRPGRLSRVADRLSSCGNSQRRAHHEPARCHGRGPTDTVGNPRETHAAGRHSVMSQSTKSPASPPKVRVRPQRQAEAPRPCSGSCPGSWPSRSVWLVLTAGDLIRLAP